jgi:hypothetical protein
MLPMFLQRSNGTVLATTFSTLLSGAPKSAISFWLLALSQTARILGIKPRTNG